jgi:hypothetical protein
MLELVQCPRSPHPLVMRFTVIIAVLVALVVGIAAAPVPNLGGHCGKRSITGCVLI